MTQHVARMIYNVATVRGRRRSVKEKLDGRTSGGTFEASKPLEPAVFGWLLHNASR